MVAIKARVTASVAKQCSVGRDVCRFATVRDM